MTRRPKSLNVELNCSKIDGRSIFRHELLRSPAKGQTARPRRPPRSEPSRLREKESGYPAYE